MAYELADMDRQPGAVADGNMRIAMAQRPDITDADADLPKSLDDLPPPGTRRWVIRRKAEVVAGVRAGLISLEEACQRYSLSVEEFLSWQRSIDRHGLRGLRTTRIQDYRSIDRSSQDEKSPHS
ncbi:CtrA inhibitor SciP [Dongia mobilis]